MSQDNVNCFVAKWNIFRHPHHSGQCDQVQWTPVSGHTARAIPAYHNILHFKEFKCIAMLGETLSKSYVWMFENLHSFYSYVMSWAMQNIFNNNIIYHDQSIWNILNILQLKSSFMLGYWSCINHFNDLAWNLIPVKTLYCVALCGLTVNIIDTGYKG